MFYSRAGFALDSIAGFTLDSKAGFALESRAVMPWIAGLLCPGL